MTREAYPKGEEEDDCFCSEQICEIVVRDHASQASLGYRLEEHSQSGRVMLTRMSTARLARSASERHWYRGSPVSFRILRARLERMTDPRVSRVKRMMRTAMTPANIICDRRASVAIGAKRKRS